MKDHQPTLPPFGLGICRPWFCIRKLASDKCWDDHVWGVDACQRRSHGARKQLVHEYWKRCCSNADAIDDSWGGNPGALVKKCIGCKEEEWELEDELEPDQRLKPDRRVAHLVDDDGVYGVCMMCMGCAIVNDETAFVEERSHAPAGHQNP